MVNGKKVFVRYLRPVASSGPRINKLSKPVRAAVSRLVKSKEETKYIATQIAINTTLDGAIHTPGTDIMPLVPAITQGTGNFQRVGEKVMPTKCKVDVYATFAQTNPGGTPPDPSINNANVMYVVMYLLRSRRCRNWIDYKASQEYTRLLDNGDGTTVPFGAEATPTTGSPFWVTDASYLTRPVEKSSHVLLKKKIVKLVRNQGTIQDGTTGAIPNLPSSAWHGSFTYKLPKLVYDDYSYPSTGVNQYPMNSCVMLAMGYAIGSNYTDFLQVGGDIAPSANFLSVTARSHVWYKDA